MFCASTLESNSSRISIVLCLLGVNGTSARCLFEDFSLCNTNTLQGARRNSTELFVNSEKKSFTVRKIEFGSKSKDNSIPSLEAEKLLLLYSRLMMSKLKMEVSFCLTVSTNGKWTRICHKRIDFSFFGTSSVWMTVIDGEILSKKEIDFHFCFDDSSFWRNNMCLYRWTTKISVFVS